MNHLKVNRSIRPKAPGVGNSALFSAVKNCQPVGWVERLCPPKLHLSAVAQRAKAEAMPITSNFPNVMGFAKGSTYSTPVIRLAGAAFLMTGVVLIRL
jgi:hypothetical protein